MKKTNQHNANLRICASCERVWWGADKSCPVCGFAHYGAIWVLGFWRAVFYWIFKFHRFVPSENRVDEE